MRARESRDSSWRDSVSAAARSRRGMRREGKSRRSQDTDLRIA
jgi:hypothetical protein